jgi:hypothetical protein
MRTSLIRKVTATPTEASQAPTAFACEPILEIRAPVIVVGEGDAPVECFAHLLGETHAIRPRGDDVCETSAAPGWVVYLSRSPGQPLRVHLYFDDIPTVVGRALRRRTRSDGPAALGPDAGPPIRGLHLAGAHQDEKVTEY